MVLPKTTPSKESNLNLKITLPSFDGTVTEWDTWRFKFYGFLRTHNLASLYENAVKTKKAPQNVIQTLSKEALDVVRVAKEKSLYGALLALETKFNFQSLHNRNLAIKKLMLENWDPETQSLEQFFTTKDDLIREKLNGKVSTEEHLMFSVYFNLPSQVNTVLAPLLAKSETNSDQLKDVVRQHNAFLQGNNNGTTAEGPGGSEVHTLKATASSSSSSSNLPSKGSPPNNTQTAVPQAQQPVFYVINKNTTGKGKGKGKGKDKQGLGLRQYPGKGTGAKTVTKTQDKLKCWLCGNFGHKKTDCALQGKGKPGGKGIGKGKKH